MAVIGLITSLFVETPIKISNRKDLEYQLNFWLFMASDYYQYDKANANIGAYFFTLKRINKVGIHPNE